jgi:hypothetical protein
MYWHATNNLIICNYRFFRYYYLQFRQYNRENR